MTIVENFKQHPMLVLLLILYIIVSYIAYIKNIEVFGFQIFPFGFSTVKLNRFYIICADKFSNQLKSISTLSYFVIGIMSVSFVPVMIFGLIFYWFDLFIISNIVRLLINYYQAISIVDFDNLLFWIVLFSSIILHEIGHGIIAAYNKIDVENTGFVIIPTILYAGYVKIDFIQFVSKDEDNSDNHESSIDETVKSLNLSHSIEEKIQLIEERINKAKQLNKIQWPIVEDRDIRKRIGTTLAVGLFVNLIIILCSIFATILIPQLLDFDIETKFIQYIIGANTLLMILNLSPIPFADGGKLLKIKIQDLVSVPKAEKLISLIDLIVKYSIYLVLFVIII